MSIVNLDEVNLLCLGHRPKMFLFLLAEMAYAYAHVGTDDSDGLRVYRCSPWLKCGTASVRGLPTPRT